MIMLLLTGCWHSLENAPKIQSDAQPFFHEALNREDIVVAEYQTSLICPDNRPASVFVVYPQNTLNEGDTATSSSSEEVAIIFHSGALTYQTSYQLDLNIIPERLTSQWAKNKVWETLGNDGKRWESLYDLEGELWKSLGTLGKHWKTLYFLEGEPSAASE